VDGSDVGLERLEDPELDAEEYYFKTRARTAEGTAVVLAVRPNDLGEFDPEPEDVSAIDRYNGMVEVRLAGFKDEELQAREACAIFNELAATRPDVALVLSHALCWIVAAYLPGSAVRAFPPRTSLDADAIDTWRPWVVAG
jgi:hypothetical protein